MTKRIFIGVLFILFLTAIWYLLIKNHDYKITFTTPHAPGIVYNALESWNNWEPTHHKVVATISKVPFSELRQEFIISDSIIGIQWLIKRESDSVTKVTAFLTDKNHRMPQKLKVIFSNTDFVKRSLKTIKRIKGGLEEHQADYGISSIEIATFPKQTAAYMTLQGQLNDKAKLMMAHTADILEYIRMNDLQLIGDPFIEVTKWCLNDDAITFDFCFPIAEQVNYPESDMVKVKTTGEQKALKTTFNGNYKISDRAWFTLIDYADRNHMEVNHFPLEVFLNDPHSGGDELSWKADVYLPLKKQ